MFKTHITYNYARFSLGELVICLFSNNNFCAKNSEIRAVRNKWKTEDFIETVLYYCNNIEKITFETQPSKRNNKCILYILSKIRAKYIKFKGRCDIALLIPDNTKYLGIKGNFNFEKCIVHTVIIARELPNMKNIICDRLFLIGVKNNTFTRIDCKPEIYLRYSEVNFEKNKINNKDIDSVRAYKIVRGRDIEDSDDSASSTEDMDDANRF